MALGEKGELCTRGYLTMLGYWHDEEKTREAIKPDRWFHSGCVDRFANGGRGATRQLPLAATSR